MRAFLADVESIGIAARANVEALEEFALDQAMLAQSLGLPRH